MPGTADYDVWLVVLVILGASLFMIPIFLLMRMTGGRKKEPVVFVSSDAARKHIALIWLIRGGEALFVVPVLLVILLIGLGFFLTINPFRQPQVHGEFFSVIMLIIILLVSARMILNVLHDLAKSGGEIFQRLQKVNANSVSNFAFIFAALSSHDLYQLMPPELPKFIRVSVGDVIVLHRDILSLIVFFVLWHFIKAVLLRVLEMNPSATPQNPPPIDPETPEFPRKSPLVQL